MKRPKPILAALQRASVPGPLAAARVLRALWLLGAAGEERAVSVARVAAATGLTRAEVLAWGPASATPTQVVREARDAGGEPVLYLAGALVVERTAQRLKWRAKRELALADQLLAAARRADELLLGGRGEDPGEAGRERRRAAPKNKLARAARPAQGNASAGRRAQREP